VLTVGQGSTDVFTEPDGGWSGTVHQAATLTASNQANFFDNGAAISGRFAFVGAGSVVDVFREPPGGWSGSVAQVGQLLAIGRSVAVSGSTVVVGSDGGSDQEVSVFSEPKSGWSGTPAASATRTFTAAYDSPEPYIAISGSTVVAMILAAIEHECPCLGFVSARSEPAGGWSGTTAVDNFFRGAPFTADVSGGAGVALGNDGSTAVVGASDGVHMYAVGVPPTLSHLALTGLEAGKPRLNLKLQGSAVSSITLRLPNGLRFASHRKQRSDGLTIDGTTKPRIALETRSVSIELKPPSSQISLTARAPALIEEQSLTAKLRAIVAYNNTHHRQQALKLALAIGIRNAAGQTTELTAHITLPSGH